MARVLASVAVVLMCTSLNVAAELDPCNVEFRRCLAACPVQRTGPLGAFDNSCSDRCEATVDACIAQMGAKSPPASSTPQPRQTDQSPGSGRAVVAKSCDPSGCIARCGLGTQASIDCMVSCQRDSDACWERSSTSSSASASAAPAPRLGSRFISPRSSAATQSKGIAGNAFEKCSGDVSFCMGNCAAGDLRCLQNCNTEMHACFERFESGGSSPSTSSPPPSGGPNSSSSNSLRGAAGQPSGRGNTDAAWSRTRTPTASSRTGTASPPAARANGSSHDFTCFEGPTPSENPGWQDYEAINRCPGRVVIPYRVVRKIGNEVETKDDVWLLLSCMKVTHKKQFFKSDKVTFFPARYEGVSRGFCR